MLKIFSLEKNPKRKHKNCVVKKRIVRIRKKARKITRLRKNPPPSVGERIETDYGRGTISPDMGRKASDGSKKRSKYDVFVKYDNGKTGYVMPLPSQILRRNPSRNKSEYLRKKRPSGRYSVIVGFIKKGPKKVKRYYFTGENFSTDKKFSKQYSLGDANTIAKKILPRLPHEIYGIKVENA